jgi:hypothetical protein
MALFMDWLVYRDAATLLRLLEHAEFFDPKSYNPVFEAELDKLIARISDPGLRQQVAKLHNMDFGNYVARSLKRAGFKGDDAIQENLHQICIRLLVKPGGLFRHWNPQKHGPLERRFRASVWNAIRKIAEKNRNYRKRMTATDPAVMAQTHPGRQAYSDVVDKFRQLVARKLGPLASGILDQRLRGEESKTLVGQPELGSPSAYILKREVGEIKKLAHQFAVQSGDPAFLGKLEKAMTAEAETVAKRKAAVAGRQSSGAVV